MMPVAACEPARLLAVDEAGVTGEALRERIANNAELKAVVAEAIAVHGSDMAMIATVEKDRQTIVAAEFREAADDDHVGRRVEGRPPLLHGDRAQRRRRAERLIDRDLLVLVEGAADGGAACGFATGSSDAYTCSAGRADGTTGATLRITTGAVEAGREPV